MIWLFWTIKREIAHRSAKRNALREMYRTNGRCADLEHTRRYQGHINY